MNQHPTPNEQRRRNLQQINNNLRALGAAGGYNNVQQWLNMSARLHATNGQPGRHKAQTWRRTENGNIILNIHKRLPKLQRYAELQSYSQNKHISQNIKNQRHAEAISLIKELGIPYGENVFNKNVLKRVYNELAAIMNPHFKARS